MRNRIVLASIILGSMTGPALIGPPVQAEGISARGADQSASSLTEAALSLSPNLPPPPHIVPQRAKPVPQGQTPEEFQQALGVPLGDAGGGTHAALLQNTEAAKASLVKDGYAVNQTRLNYNSMSADIFIAYKTVTVTDRAAALSVANGAPINFITVTRSAAEGETLQARLSADTAALTKQGIIISTTGLVEDGATVLVTLINGTAAQTDYLLKTYGPTGLSVSIAAGPIPYES